MNADEIRTMEAGREMDALVAEHVMDWIWDTHNPLNSIMWVPSSGAVGVVIFHDGSEDDGIKQILGIPHFSADIAAAWDVVEKMVPIQFGFQLAIESPPGPYGDWEVNFYNGGDHYVYGDTAPLAICKASLLAILGAEE